MRQSYDDLPLVQRQSKPDYRPPRMPGPVDTGFRQQTIRRVGLFSAFKVGCLMWMIPHGLIAVFVGVAVFGASRSLNVWANYAAYAAFSLLIGAGLAGLGVLLIVALYNIVSFFFGGFSLTLASEGESSVSEPGVGWDVLAVIAPLVAFGATALLCVVLAGAAMNTVAGDLNRAMATANAQLSQPRR